MKTNVTIDTQSLADIDLSPLQQYVDWNPNAKYFDQPAGQEHYRLIAHICSQLPKGSTVVDIGTYTGASALAASYNEDINIITYDILDHLPAPKTKPCIRDRPNIDVRVSNCLFDMEQISGATLVILDVDPHDGIQESEILDALISQKFTGMLLLDDIHLNDGMKTFYDDTVKTLAPDFAAVPDITPHGHFSGTGLLYYVDKFDVRVQ